MDTQTARQFPSGANRSDDSQKPDFEGYLSPLVLERYGQYMLAHQYHGKRTSDNWQKGIPKDAYMKSAFRHFMDWWMKHRDPWAWTREETEDALCGTLFNAMGYLHELLKERNAFGPRGGE